MSETEPKLIPAPGNPMAVAREFLYRWRYGNGGQLTLRAWRGGWMHWSETHWVELAPDDIRAQMYALVEHAKFVPDGKAKPEPWSPTARKISDLIDALRAITHLSEAEDAPSWIGSRPELDGVPIPDGPVIACTNGLLHLRTRGLYAHTPSYFNVAAVPFAYDPAASEPKAWIAFLQSIWPDDPQCIDALQEWFGVVVSGTTALQKILMVIGPPRAGKGTISRVLTALVGTENLASPTLTSLSTQFGMASLIGKPLAIIADARIGRGDTAPAVERLLSISGEDTQQIARKYRADWIGRLPTRFTIMSNELPKLADSTGVITTRLILLVMTQSWIGHEDVDLDRKLTAELPGIFAWALKGLERVETHGRITNPDSSRQALAALSDSIAPHIAFVRDCLDRSDPAAMAIIDDVWQAWRDWCEEQGRQPGAKNHLGRDLRSVIPGLREFRPGANEPDRRRRYVGLRVGSADGEGTRDVGPTNRDSCGSSGSRGSGGMRVDDVYPHQTRTDPRQTRMNDGHARDPKRHLTSGNVNADPHDPHDPHQSAELSLGGSESCHCGRSWPEHREGDLGPCARCQTLTHRYGSGGIPTCQACRSGGTA